MPLIERLRFLGIFSNNLDEFFQVRYATVKIISQSSKTGKRVFAGRSAEALLKEITKRVIELQDESLKILNGIYSELERENIFFIDHNEVKPEHEDFLKNYFIQNVNPALVTIILSQNRDQDLSANKAFLIVTMTLEQPPEDENIEMLRLAFYQVLISSGPFLGAALAIGLIIGIIQAATSIQEMTLSFVPKIVLVILAMGMMANFFLVSLTDYFQFIFETISGIK